MSSPAQSPAYKRQRGSPSKLMGVVLPGRTSRSSLPTAATHIVHIPWALQARPGSSPASATSAGEDRESDESSEWDAEVKDEESEEYEASEAYEESEEEAG